MKIVVIYGEDEAAARARYAQIITGVKKKNWEVVNLKLSDNFKLAERLSSGSLFPGEILFTLEDLKKTPVSELRWLKENFDKYEGSLLLFTKGGVPFAVRNALPKDAKYEKFDEPQIIWTFLDSFYPGNSKKCLSNLSELLKGSAIELVIAMLARHLRDLYWVKEGGKGMNVSGWRMSKLKAQAAKFTKEALADTITTLAEVDIMSKTGGADSRFLLEILIAEKLV